MVVRQGLSNGTCTMSLEGRLDSNSAPDLEDRINTVFEVHTGVKFLILDLKRCEYMSSAGLRVVLNAQKKMMGLKGRLIIKNVNETIMEVFDATGFSDVLMIE